MNVEDTYAEGRRVLQRLRAAEGKGDIARRNARKALRRWCRNMLAVVDASFTPPARRKRKPPRGRPWIASVLIRMQKRGYVTCLPTSTEGKICTKAGVHARIVGGSWWLPAWAYHAAEGGVSRVLACKRSRALREAELARAALAAQGDRS
jgi:hypothetical protein